MKLFLLNLLCFLPCLAYAQAPLVMPTPRTIEVRGSAEVSVAPNVFIFGITIRERFEKKDKITLESQEGLKEALAGLGIDVTKDLTIADLSTHFGYVPGHKQKDTLGSRNYNLKLTDLGKIDKLQAIAEDLDLARLDLVESKYSDMATIRRQTKEAAVQAAKGKAAYMLEAIGEHVGRPLLVQESSESEDNPQIARRYERTLESNSFFAGKAAAAPAGVEVAEPLSFTQIKVRYEVLAKFEIQ